MSKKIPMEVEFLHRERSAIVKEWRRRIETSVNSQFFAEGGGVSSTMMEHVFDDIVSAVDKNLYRNLNNAFDALLKDGRNPGMPVSDVRELMFQFVPAARQVLERSHPEGHPGRAEIIYQRLKVIEHDLKEVYSERLARNLLHVMAQQRDQIIDRWAAELPTPIISDHFSVLDEEDRRLFLQSTYDIFVAMLRGDEDELCPAQGDQPARTRLNDYLFKVVEYYEPKGFLISDMHRALSYPLRLLEPSLFKKLHHNAAEYRVALLSLVEAIETLVRVFSEAYSERQMKNYYNEVSIMLHRIKNKLTPVLTTAETILMLPKDDAGDDDEVMMAGDPMIMTVPESEVLNDWFEKTEQLVQSISTAIESGEGTGERTGAGSPAEISRLLAEYNQYVEEQQAVLVNARYKLDVGSTEMINELMQMVYDAGKTTNQLALELQLRQNELYQREPPRRSELDIYSLVYNAWKESVTEAASKRQVYELHAEDRGVFVFGVENELKRPFIQVIENAIKYTPEGGEVTVSLEYEPSHVLFSVKDTGIGIPKGEEDAVFGLCERCSNATEFNKVGTGTGLYNDRKTILQHNGKIWVESNGVGTGSTFFIRLPIHRRAAIAAGQPSASASPAAELAQTEAPVDAGGPVQT